jgi:hypothetical protein
MTAKASKSGGTARISPPPETFVQPAGTSPANQLAGSTCLPLAARPPTDPEERNELTFAVLGGAPDIDYRPAYYASYAEIAPELARRSAPATELVRRYPEIATDLEHWLTRHGVQRTVDARYMPYFVRDAEIVMMLRPDGSVIGPYSLPAP